VQVLLHGDFEISFTAARQQLLLPTDTMKNTVYSLLGESKSATIEAFAMELATICWHTHRYRGPPSRLTKEPGSE